MKQSCVILTCFNHVGIRTPLAAVELFVSKAAGVCRPSPADVLCGHTEADIAVPSCWLHTLPEP